MCERRVRWTNLPEFWGALVLAVALLVNLGDLENPSGALWDESYYLTTTQRYLEGRAQYASHPPLGLMLMAGGARLIGGRVPETTHFMVALKKVTGEQIPDNYDFFAVRFASALCSALASVAFFSMMLWWTRRPRFAALATIPMLFDNALIVQSRAAQLDGPQLLFTVLALWAFLAALRGTRGANVAFGICVGLAATVRMNGALLGLLGLAILWAAIRREGWGWGRLREAAAMLVPFVATVAAMMLLHVAITPGMPVFDEAGSKDLLYMSPQYQHWLATGGILTPAVAWDAIAGYWRFMLADLAGMTRTDPNGSHPLLWPIGQRTITYRWAASNRGTSYVQLVPNLAGWWAAVAAFLVMLVDWARRVVRQERPIREVTDVAATTLCGWYGLFLGVNIALAQSRVMYIYHYFMGLVAAYTLLALLLARWLDPGVPSIATRRRVAILGGTAIIVMFLALFPLTYNVRLSESVCNAYNGVLPVVRCIRSQNRRSVKP